MINMLTYCLSLSFYRPGVLKDLKTMGSVSLFIFFITLLVLARQVSSLFKLDTIQYYRLHYVTCLPLLKDFICEFEIMSTHFQNRIWKQVNTCSRIWCRSKILNKITCPTPLPSSRLCSLCSLHMKDNLSWHRFGVLCIFRVPSIISDPRTDVLDRNSSPKTGVFPESHSWCKHFSFWVTATRREGRICFRNTTLLYLLLSYLGAGSYQGL